MWSIFAVVCLVLAFAVAVAIITLCCAVSRQFGHVVRAYIELEDVRMRCFNAIAVVMNGFHKK